MEKETGRKLKNCLANNWKDYMHEHFNRVVNFAQQYMDKRLGQMKVVWEIECKNAVKKNLPCSMSAVTKMYLNGNGVKRPRFDKFIFT